MRRVTSELHSHHRTNRGDRGGLSVRLCAESVVAAGWGADGCCDFEYLEESVISAQWFQRGSIPRSVFPVSGSLD